MSALRPQRGPAAYANPFDVSNAYATAMRLALGLAVLPGLGTGLLLVLIAAERLSLPVALAWPQLAQAHGQVQTLGFTLLFIVAVGLQLFPRFLGSPLSRPDRAVWGALVIAAAAIIRLIGQPLEAGQVRVVALGLSTVALPVGAVLAGSAFHGLRPAGSPSPSWRRFVAVGGLALGGSLVLHAIAGGQLISGFAVVQQNVDEALVHLELVGFATGLVLGVASRILGRFLLLNTKPALEPRVPILAAAWGLGLVGVSTGWLLDSAWLRVVGSGVELCTLGAWSWLIGLYEAPIRESGTPRVTDPTRRWIRLTFAFLGLSLALNTGLFARDALTGTISSSAELSAARHALAQGFLLPLMVSMASRLLPVISASALRHPRLIELTLDALFVGALLRVAAEAFGGYAPPAGHFVALGSALGIAAFSLFAAWLWWSLGHLPPLSQNRA